MSAPVGLADGDTAATIASDAATAVSELTDDQAIRPALPSTSVPVSTVGAALVRPALSITPGVGGAARSAAVRPNAARQDAPESGLSGSVSIAAPSTAPTAATATPLTNGGTITTSPGGSLFAALATLALMVVTLSTFLGAATTLPLRPAHTYAPTPPPI